MIRIRYDTHVHDLRFPNQEQQSEWFGRIFTVNPTHTSAKAK